VIGLRSGRRPALILCLVLVGLLAAPAAPAGAASWNGRYSLWRNGAFATQYLDYSCVGATIQIMLNLVRGGRDHAKGRQLNYLDYAQTHNKYPATDSGADPQGWAEALVHFGAGDDYGWNNASTMQAALRTAASQMRQTGKPVGLLVHLGRHAWVMTGFEATADPAQTDDFEVTAAEVLGPLWPLGTLNGEHFDPGPGTWLDLRALSRKFDPYLVPGQPAWSGKYVTVLPRVSDVAGQGSVQQPEQPQQPSDVDIRSALGWIWVLDRLARAYPVRDFLWLP